MKTYDFLVVDLQATDDEVHRFLSFAVAHNVLKISCVVLVCRTFQIESISVVIDDFEHGHVIWVALGHLELLLETVVAIVRHQREVVARAHDDLLL